MKNLIILIFIFLSISARSQEKRLALIIGNSAYEHGGVLPNPVNDAYAMEQALLSVDFDVVVFYNLDQSDMKRAIDDFGLKLKEYDVGLFYYAGHGIQAKGNNYLIPIDANLTSENDVEYDCIEAGRVLGKMEDAENSANIIILDACRNNPFERSWTRSTSGRGLVSMDAPLGSIIAYATAPGTTASDGVGKNGLYTSELIKYIAGPGFTIEDVFKLVRKGVLAKSAGKQIPWESTSLVNDIYLVSVDEHAYKSDLDKSLYSEDENIGIALLPEQVIERYIASIGGRSNIENIEDYLVVYKWTALQKGKSRAFYIATYYHAPNTYLNYGTQVNKRKFRPIKLPEMTDTFLYNVFFQELKLYSEENIHNLSIRGIDKINGKSVIIVDALYEDKNNSLKHINHHDAETYLMVSSEVSGILNGETLNFNYYYSDFREVNKIMFPFIIHRADRSSSPSLVLKGTIEKLSFNTGITENEFFDNIKNLSKY